MQLLCVTKRLSEQSNEKQHKATGVNYSSTCTQTFGKRFPRRASEPAAPDVAKWDLKELLISVTPPLGRFVSCIRSLPCARSLHQKKTHIGHPSRLHSSSWPPAQSEDSRLQPSSVLALRPLVVLSSHPELPVVVLPCWKQVERIPLPSRNGSFLRPFRAHATMSRVTPATQSPAERKTGSWLIASFVMKEIRIFFWFTPWLWWIPSCILRPCRRMQEQTIPFCFDKS